MPNILQFWPGPSFKEGPSRKKLKFVDFLEVW